MPSRAAIKPWWAAALLGGILLVVWLARDRGPADPVYEGRKLSEWIERHPREHAPVMRALGTNALPFLVSELQATDSALAKAVERLLGKASIGPFWSTASRRKYRARLGLQALGAEAASALVDLVLSKPIELKEGDLAWQAALTLKWMAGAEAQGYVLKRLQEGLASGEPRQRRNACLAFAAGVTAGTNEMARIVELADDRDLTVRAAALRAIWFQGGTDGLILQVLKARLEDEHAAIRRLAIEGLGSRTSNAVTAASALRAAYTAEKDRPNLRDDIEGVYGHPFPLSVDGMRNAILEALQQVDPGGPQP